MDALEPGYTAAAASGSHLQGLDDVPTFESDTNTQPAAPAGPPGTPTITADTSVLPLMQLPDHLLTKVLSSAWSTLDPVDRRSLRLTSHIICKMVNGYVQMLRLDIKQQCPHLLYCACARPSNTASTHQGCAPAAAQPSSLSVQPVVAVAAEPHQMLDEDYSAWDAPADPDEQVLEQAEPAEAVVQVAAAELAAGQAAQDDAATGEPSASTSRMAAPGANSTASDIASPQAATAVPEDQAAHTTPGQQQPVQQQQHHEQALVAQQPPQPEPQAPHQDHDGTTQVGAPQQQASSTHSPRPIPDEGGAPWRCLCAKQAPSPPQACDMCCAVVSRLAQFANVRHVEASDGDADCFSPSRSLLATALPLLNNLKALTLKPGPQVCLGKEDVEVLGRACPQLEELYLPAPWYDDALCSLPEALPKLNTLHIGHFWKTPPLGVLAALSGLTCLQVRAVILAPDSMQGLSALSSLRDLRLGPVYHMTSDALSPIANLPSLRCLHLWAMFGMGLEHAGNGLASRDLTTFLQRLPQLQALSLHNFPGGLADDRLLAALGRMPNLLALKINTKARIIVDAHIGTFRRMTRLLVGGDKLEPRMLRGLGLSCPCPALQELVLESAGGAREVAEVVWLLCKQVQLRSLVIRVDGWPLSQLHLLSALPQLETLRAVVSSESARPDPEELAQLKAHLPGTLVTVSVHPMHDLVRFEDELLPQTVSGPV